MAIYIFDCKVFKNAFFFEILSFSPRFVKIEKKIFFSNIYFLIKFSEDLSTYSNIERLPSKKYEILEYRLRKVCKKL